MAFRIFKRLSELLDVDTSGVADGDALTYDTATSTWIPGAGGGGGGAPTTVDYLVGTASGSLSAEIVVGASPGGELGGTWASPTVDTTHSGSSHASVQAAAEAAAAAALLAHTTDSSDAHDASAISILDAANDFTATDVEAALAELQSDHETDAQNLADHLADATAAHAASAISFTPDGSIAATTVQAAIVEVRDEAGAGGAPTDVDYLVGTASGGLSAEIVVGTSPGGELGGTWASPTVDATHSGSTHAAVQAAAEATAAAALSAHEADTTSVHGITDTSALYRAAGTDVALADGGTGASLVDPGADRILFWDDSAGAVTWLTAGTNLTITDTTIAASGSGGGTVSIPIDLNTPRTSTLGGNSFWSVVALTDWDAGHWEFVKDVEGKVYGTCRVPAGYASGGTLRLEIAANATSGVTRLQVGTKAVADGESMNPTLTDETAQDITVPGTAYLRKLVSFTLTEALAANDVLIVEIFHDGDHANDTLAVNTLLFGAWLEVTT